MEIVKKFSNGNFPKRFPFVHLKNKTTSNESCLWKKEKIFLYFSNFKFCELYLSNSLSWAELRPQILHCWLWIDWLIGLIVIVWLCDCVIVVIVIVWLKFIHVFMIAL